MAKGSRPDQRTGYHALLRVRKTLVMAESDQSRRGCLQTQQSVGVVNACPHNNLAALITSMKGLAGQWLWGCTEILLHNGMT
jgi:hypothetical protein